MVTGFGKMEEKCGNELGQPYVLIRRPAGDVTLSDDFWLQAI